jgi:hypothetical protein
MADADWRDLAECKGMDVRLFFPEALLDYMVPMSEGKPTRILGLTSRFHQDLSKAFEEEAKHICLSCNVRSECLEWALDTNQLWGIWGGIDAADRKRIKTKRTRLRRDHAVTP